MGQFNPDLNDVGTEDKLPLAVMEAYVNALMIFPLTRTQTLQRAAAKSIYGELKYEISS